MKSIETNEWCISTDGEYFFDVYDSKEEAIENLRDSYNDGYIGRCVDIRFAEEDIISHIEIVHILSETLSDEVGEASEDWEFTTEQEEEISQIVAKAIIDYINKNHLQPRCYKVIDIEFIEGEVEYDTKSEEA